MCCVVLDSGSKREREMGGVALVIENGGVKGGLA